MHTYVRAKLMVVTYSVPGFIGFLQLPDCHLNHMDISKLRAVIEEKLIVGIHQVNFIYYDEIHIKSTTLSEHIKKVIYCGSNMHSKGTYMIDTPSVIQTPDFLPRQIALDYLTAVIILCHNIQSKSSYLKTIPGALCSTVQYSLKNICDIEKVVLTDSCINEEAGYDIAIVLSNSDHLRKLYLGGNNLQAAGVINITKGLQNVSNLTLLDLNNNNISEEAASDIAAVLSHNIKLKKLYLYKNNLKSTGAITIAQGLLNTSSLTEVSLGNNNINEEAAGDIAVVLSHNTKLYKN